MYWLKACPRCRGDLHGDSDAHGAYVACLQCGHYLTPAQESAMSSMRVELFEPAGAYSLAESGERSLSAA